MLPFLKTAKATVDLEAHYVRVPIFRDFGGFNLVYRRPALTVPACNVSHLDPTHSSARNAGVAREMLGLMEKFSPGAPNLTKIRQTVSALVVAASGLHDQVQDRSAIADSQALYAKSDPSVNGRFVPLARPGQSAPGLAHTQDALIDIFGDSSQKRLAVASALATPARSEAALAPVTSSLRPPAHQAFSVLPSLDV